MNSEIRNIFNDDDKIIHNLLDMYYNKQLSGDAFLYYIASNKVLDKHNYNRIKKIINSENFIEGIPNETEPLISIIIPTFNRKEMLLKAVNSVLNQSYRNYQIIIINDCSTDGTDAVIKKLSNDFPCIQGIHNAENKNAGYNRNLGFKESNGEYVVFLDDDDFYLDKEFLAKAICKHIANDNLSFVGFNAFIKGEVGERIDISNLNITGRIDGKEYLKNFQVRYKKPLSTFTTVFKKESLDKLHFESMTMMNDSSIYLRALLVGDAYIIEDIIGVYVIHGNNISSKLSADFIIQNLAEKVWVYNTAIQSDGDSLTKNWLSEQISLTLRYYIKGSKPNLFEIIKIIRWIGTNVPNKRIIIITRILAYFISK